MCDDDDDGIGGAHKPDDTTMPRELINIVFGWCAHWLQLNADRMRAVVYLMGGKEAKGNRQQLEAVAGERFPNASHINVFRFGLSMSSYSIQLKL